MSTRSRSVRPWAAGLALLLAGCAAQAPPEGFDTSTPVVVRVDNDTSEDQVVGLIRSAGGAVRPIVVESGETRLEILEQRAFGTGPVEVAFVRWWGWELRRPRTAPYLRQAPTARSSLQEMENRYVLQRKIRVPGGTTLYVRLLPEKRASYVLLFGTSPAGVRDAEIRFGLDGRPVEGS